MVIHPCNAQSKNIMDEITLMVKMSRISGVVLTPPFSEDPKFVEHLTNLDVNVVRIMSGEIAPDNLSPCVMVNDHKAAFDITDLSLIHI